MEKLLTQDYLGKTIHIGLTAPTTEGHMFIGGARIDAISAGGIKVSLSDKHFIVPYSGISYMVFTDDNT